MKYEYLIFNFLVVLVPIIYSFEKRLFFISKWRFVCPALLISLPPYITWDIIVTGKHWHFNPKYTLDHQLRTNLFARTQTYIYIIVIATLILLFNGYLTARPVVLYGEAYQTGVRIFTIPIEDFGYGFSLILLNTIFYEKLKEGNFAQ